MWQKYGTGRDTSFLDPAAESFRQKFSQMGDLPNIPPLQKNMLANLGFLYTKALLLVLLHVKISLCS